MKFARRFSKLIRDRSPRCGIFYNMPNVLHVDHSIGSAAMEPFRTQWEIESLPSGFWGYYHFPRLGRRAMASEQFWLGQTGRFQKMWGDFGGIKPVPALEFECFRSQALGGGNNVGDQLHPRGKPDTGVYNLIQTVFAQCAEADRFYEGTVAIPQVGIFPASGSVDQASADLTLEGAVQLCEEAHYDAVVVDDSVDLGQLSLIILPDAATLTPAATTKLKAFVATGGKLIASARGGFDADGNWALADEIPLTFDGDVDTVPTYWRPRADFMPGAEVSDRVVYAPGLLVKPDTHRVLVDRVPPYFKRRTDVTFSSHFQAPPRPENRCGASCGYRRQKLDILRRPDLSRVSPNREHHRARRMAGRYAFADRPTPVR